MARQNDLKDENERLTQEVQGLRLELHKASVALKIATDQREEQANKHIETLVAANLQIDQAKAHIEKLDKEVNALAEQVSASKEA